MTGSTFLRFLAGRAFVESSSREGRLTVTEPEACKPDCFPGPGASRTKSEFGLFELFVALLSSDARLPS